VRPGVDFVPVIDSLGREPRLALGETLPVLGIPIEFRTNSEYVLDVVRESFDVCQAGDVDTTTPSLRVRIIVTDGDEGDGRVGIRHLCPDAHRFIAHSPGSVGVSDPLRREAVAYVTTALAANRSVLRGEMLEALTFALVAQFDRHPLHAAAVARDDRVALLVGESGAGKSTLAYLARCAGFDVLAEDHAWVQLDPELRIWGGARRIRLGDDAARHFPEVASVTETSTAGGKTKRVVSLAPRTSAASTPVVCLLSRGNRARLEPAAPDVVHRTLMTGVSPGFDRFPERHARVVHTLASRGGWHLQLSDDPREALPLLDRILPGDVAP
jgi:hypothetical protein